MVKLIKKLLDKLLDKFRKPVPVEAFPVKQNRWPIRKGKCIEGNIVRTFYFTAEVSNKEIGLSLYGKDCQIGSDPFVGAEEQVYKEAGRRAELYEKITGEEVIEVKYNDIALLCQDA